MEAGGDRLMEVFTGLLEWFANPAHWQGSHGIPARGVEHAWYSIAATLTAMAIALPIGLVVGHTGRGGTLAINIANIGRAIPSFGVIILAVVLLGIGFLPPLIALVAFAIPPILTNAYTGIREVDPNVRETAQAMGMRPWEVLMRVEVPVALPLIMAGIRTAAVQVVATATLAAFVGLGGYGRYIVNGWALQDFAQVLAGAVLVAALAIVFEVSLAATQRLIVPTGMQRDATETATDTKLRTRTA
jgi:osmoprotectant transport system permease protein